MGSEEWKSPLVGCEVTAPRLAEHAIRGVHFRSKEMKMTTDDRTALIRSAFEAMVPEFGKPLRSSLQYEGAVENRLTIPTEDDSSNTEIHPVFRLSHHFLSGDDYAKGYTDNPYRGDHISVPAYLGFSEEIAILETSFHKGFTFVEVITFPEADRESRLYQAAVSLVSAEETR